jgi:hypothetical protein
MQRLIFNGFIAVLGKGWGGGWCFIISMFLAKVQETPKPLQSHSKDYSKAIKSYSPNNLLCFLFFVLECLE